MKSFYTFLLVLLFVLVAVGTPAAAVGTPESAPPTVAVSTPDSAPMLMASTRYIYPTNRRNRGIAPAPPVSQRSGELVCIDVAPGVKRCFRK